MKQGIPLEELKVSRIYCFDFGPNTQVIGRYKSKEIPNIIFFDHLHYWNGYESFKQGGYCVTSGLTIREASQAEKMNLVRFEIENNCI